MKKILSLLVFIFLVLPVQAVTLEGSVTYTVEQAREAAFKDIEWEIPKQLLRKHRKDPNYTMNMYAKKYSQKVLRDRAITFFSSGSYAYYYFDNPEYGFFYGEKGNLTMIGKGYSEEYPYKTYKYNLKGKLFSVTFHVSGDECYIFLPNGKLMGHWIGEVCYDTDGNIRLNRK